MRFASPEYLLLLVPALLALWFLGRRPGPSQWLRWAIVLFIGIALARPELTREDAGADLIVVVDRSRSMPEGSDGRAEELIRLLEQERGKGDRLAVVTFGRAPRVEAPLNPEGGFTGFQHTIDNEASDLGAALDAAASLVPEERRGHVLVISDGRATGEDVRAAAHRLAARGIVVDYRHLGREQGPLDLAVTGIEVPPNVSKDEPFQLTATVHASEATEAVVVLERDGVPLARGPYRFEAGNNLLTFRDAIAEEGLARYRLRVETAQDKLVENDTGRAVLRVRGPPRVLLMSSQGRASVLARALTDAGILLEVRDPGPLTLGELENVNTVVLDDVDANHLGEVGLQSLAKAVEFAGVGLVMTGGRHSFGEGGYRRSPLEPLLPVSLELRQDQHRAAVAMSLLLDSSCSMAASVADGRTKMELATEGVMAGLSLLDERDEASLHVIDTSPTRIFGMKPVHHDQPFGGTQVGGGGIYLGIALRAGAREILRSDKPTRHIILFSDAADTEEPDDYRDTIAMLRSQNVTVSVIGLGSESDPDVALLREVAQLGGGRIYFSNDAMSLPRLFSQETIAVARSSFIDGKIGLSKGTDLALLGRPPAGGLPTVGGYNVTYLKPSAGIGLRTTDENKAPLLALWTRGEGRVVAYTGEVDGTYTGAIRDWAGYRALLEQMVRWTLPPPDKNSAAMARATRRGDQLHVAYELDSSATEPGEPPKLVLLSEDGSSVTEVALRPTEPGRYETTLPLPGSGTWFPVVRTGDRALRVEPVALPYAPEFEPASAVDGRAVLADLAQRTGGVERLSMETLFGSLMASPRTRSFAPLLVWLAIVLVISEVFVRRFLAQRQRVSAAWLKNIVGRPVRGAEEASVTHARREPAASPGTPHAPLDPPGAAREEPPPVEQSEGVDAALARAKSRRRGTR